MENNTIYTIDFHEHIKLFKYYTCDYFRNTINNYVKINNYKLSLKYHDVDYIINFNNFDNIYTLQITSCKNINTINNLNLIYATHIKYCDNLMNVNNINLMNYLDLGYNTNLIKLNNIGCIQTMILTECIKLNDVDNEIHICISLSR